MQDAATVLSIIRERSEQGQPLEHAYHLLYNPTFYLYAYGRISSNAGAMTPGVTGETVDGMSLEKIHQIIALIRREAYVWTPVRRIHIPKKKGGKRPLGIPDWSDKLVEEVLRLILEAHFEPRFSARSHGFRPNRGCHTALQEVKTWTGTKWFLEGDIKGCFDGVDHEVLLSILAETIHDNRLLRLIRHMLQAGYMEGWEYGTTLSGTPQGGVLSPLLANVYLNKLDQFVETELQPAYTRGTVREDNREYRRIYDRLWRARKSGDKQAVRRLALALRLLPSCRPDDPAFRRLRYVRYADDFLLGFIGPVEEAEEIKQRLGVFLHEQLKLDLSREKTLTTHARTQAARFLNYAIRVQYRDDLLTNKGRNTNGKVALRIPADVVEAYRASYIVDGHPKRNMLLAQESDFTIVDRYASIFRGIYHYYAWAQNVSWLLRLKYVMESSLLHTLAAKHRTSVKQILKRYKTQTETPSGLRKCLEVRIEREQKAPLIARFGGFPVIRHEVPMGQDRLPYQGPRIERNERIQRLLHEECELCGKPGPVEGHHIRKLADLKRHGKYPPAWVQVMAMRRRKTLFVCRACHVAITHGRITIVRSPSQTATEKAV
jgi:group II intron reverse transcriptase/maturase